MRYIMKYSLIFFSFFVLFQSCKSQPSAQKLTEASMLRTSQRAMELIKSKDYENFMFLIPKELKNSFPDDKLRPAIDIASDIINKEGISTGDNVQSRIEYRKNGTDTIAINTIAFLYKGSKESQNPFSHEITFSFIEKYGDKRIVSFNINADPQNAGNSGLKIQPIDKLKLNSDNVGNYRVYYSEGLPAKTVYGKNKGVFALEGDSKTFKSSGLKDIFAPIFKELENCNLKNPEKFTTMLDYSDAEYIQAELLFNNLEYGIFIYLPIKVKAAQNNKIIIRQLQMANLGYQYYLDKSDNKKLSDLLENIKTKNWSTNYVDNP